MFEKPHRQSSGWIVRINCLMHFSKCFHHLCSFLQHFFRQSHLAILIYLGYLWQPIICVFFTLCFTTARKLSKYKKEKISPGSLCLNFRVGSKVINELYSISTDIIFPEMKSPRLRSIKVDIKFTGPSSQNYWEMGNLSELFSGPRLYNINWVILIYASLRSIQSDVKRKCFTTLFILLKISIWNHCVLTYTSSNKQYCSISRTSDSEIKLSGFVK